MTGPGAKRAPKLEARRRRTFVVAASALGVAVVLAAIVALRSHAPEPAPAPRPPGADVLAVVQRAQALYDAGQIPDGVDMLRREIEAHPGAPLLHYTVGVFLLAKNENADAAAALEEEIRTNPGYAGSYTQVGLAYGRLGRSDEAVAAFQHALSLKPGDPDSTFYLGRLLSSLARYDEAVPYLESAARSGNPTVISELGLAYRNQGNDELARDAFRRALAIDRFDSVATLNLGQLYVRLGNAAAGELLLERQAALAQQYDELDRYRRSALLRGATAANYVNLAGAYARRDDFAEALKAYQHAVELDPRNVDASNGVADMLLATDRAAEVGPWAGRSLLVDPRDWRARLLLGLAQVRRGDVAAALASFEASRTAHAWDAATYVRVSDALRVAGRAPEARAAAEAAVRLSPDDPTAMRSLALARYASGDVAGARDAARKGSAAAPTDPDLYMVQGIAASKLGDDADAERAFRDAVRLQEATLFGDEQVSRMLATYAALPDAGSALERYRRVRAGA